MDDVAVTVKTRLHLVDVVGFVARRCCNRKIVAKNIKKTGQRTLILYDRFCFCFETYAFLCIRTRTPHKLTYTRSRTHKRVPEQRRAKTPTTTAQLRRRRSRTAGRPGSGLRPGPAAPRSPRVGCFRRARGAAADRRIARRS